MKTTGNIFWICGLLLFIAFIVLMIKSNYQYTNNIESYWSLADKSSTIPKKAQYIDKFVIALESQKLDGNYDAIWLKTPDNSFDMNLLALKTLQLRLHEIETMDVTSFQYQTAIQQITQQEQGEAHDMLSIFKGVWIKNNYFMLWDWVGITSFVSIFLLIIGGIIIRNWGGLVEFFSY